jgi:prepilin-type N-terminal cleavage/methylation domain-containing protein
MNRRDLQQAFRPRRSICERATPSAALRLRGFSLIEILVVLGIIAFLTAAIVVVLPRVSNASKIAATRATIKKVDEMLNDRINGFQRWIQTQDSLAAGGTPSYVDSDSQLMAHGNLALAKLIAMKKRFRQNFPQTYAELPLPYWQPNTQYNVGSLIHVLSPSSANFILTFRCTQTTAAGKSGGSAPTWPTVPASPGPQVTDNNLTWQLIPFNTGGPNQWTGRMTESAACLYFALTRGGIFDTEPPAGSDLKGIELADTDGDQNNPGDGLLEIVDAWGHPIRFYRWPTRLIRTSMSPTATQTLTSGAYSLLLQPVYPPTSPVPGLWANALVSSLVMPSVGSSPPSTTSAELSTSIYKDLAKDPDDPLGLIQSALLQTSPPFQAADFEGMPSLSPTNQLQYLHTPDTYWTTLIVSMGTDEQLGLYEPCDTPNQPYLAPPSSIPSSSTGTSHGYLAQPKVDVPITDPTGLNAILDNITNHQQ